VGGKMSDVVSSKASRIESSIPGATTIDVAGAAHMVAGDDNTTFMQYTTAFLDSVGPRTGESAAHRSSE
jgi:hypothetical protein